MEHDGRGSRYLQREIPHRAAGETVYGGADPEGSIGVNWQWTHLEKMCTIEWNIQRNDVKRAIGNVQTKTYRSKHVGRPDLFHDGTVCDTSVVFQYFSAAL